MSLFFYATNVSLKNWWIKMGSLLWIRKTKFSDN